MRKGKVTRITADLDNTLLSVAKIRTFCIVRWLKCPVDFVTFRHSCSGKGVHVTLWIGQRLTNKEIIMIRMLLGDDNRRLMIDLKRKEMKQYLFIEKKVYNDNRKRCHR